MTTIIPHLSEAEKDIFKDFSDEYLKQVIEQAVEDLKTQKPEDGEVVFKRLRAKFEKQFGKPSE